jgi:hypothetical protein
VLGGGGWGAGEGASAPTPKPQIPNPQSPIPNQILIKFFAKNIKKGKFNKTKKNYYLNYIKKWDVKQVTF